MISFPPIDLGTWGLPEGVYHWFLFADDKPDGVMDWMWFDWATVTAQP
jgi:hypothetical protein